MQMDIETARPIARRISGMPAKAQRAILDALVEAKPHMKLTDEYIELDRMLCDLEDQEKATTP